MAIIEPQFAAEMIHSSGELRKYDDLACLANAAKNPANDNPRQIFVQDYSSGEWTGREEALVVCGSTVQTPMGSGAVAFASREAAEKFVTENQGQIVSLWEYLHQ